jgi:hypothetical protein
VRQKIQTKRLAISNVENDSDKPMKIAASEQARRDRKRVVGNAKHDANDSAGWSRDRPRGFNALGLPDSGCCPLHHRWPRKALDRRARQRGKEGFLRAGLPRLSILASLLA